MKLNLWRKFCAVSKLINVAMCTYSSSSVGHYILYFINISFTLSQLTSTWWEDVQSSIIKYIFCVVHQDCCASWTTPASVTPVRKAPTVTPTPSAEITSVPAHQDTSERPVTRMLTSAHWVKLTHPKIWTIKDTFQLLLSQGAVQLNYCQESFSTITHEFVTLLYKPQYELILSCYYGYP